MAYNEDPSYQKDTTMYNTNLNLHLNSKQSGQVVAAAIALSVAQSVVKQVKIRRKAKTTKLDNVWIKEDPKTGLVTVLELHQGGKAMQYSWNHHR